MEFTRGDTKKYKFQRIVKDENVKAPFDRYGVEYIE